MQQWLLYSLLPRLWYWDSSDERVCKGQESCIDIVGLYNNMSCYFYILRLLLVLQLAREKGCTKMSWIVMDNSREIEFYEKMGGKIKKDWLTMKLTEPELGDLAFQET